MPAVRISPKFQVVIPKQIREDLDLKPGQNLQVFAVDGRIELVPEEEVSSLRGFVRGLDTSLDRDEDRF
jgi:AbrB family looped-hinge helix DNA binding protein